MPRPCKASNSTCGSARRALLLAALATVPAVRAAAPDDAGRAWLAQHGPVRFAPERDYPPFIFSDAQGRLDGLSLGMLELVQRHTGLQVQHLPARPLAEQLALARARGADLLSSLRPTPERARYLLFTEPYVRVPAVLAVREGGGAATLAALDGRPVAVGAGYAVEPVVRVRHPGVQWQPVSDDAVALRGVADGRFAGAVVDSASLAWVARRDRLPGLVATEFVGFDYALAFAVRSDWPQLRDIVDDGLARIPGAERRALLARWLPEADAGAASAPPHAPRATALALGLTAAGLLLGWWSWWRTR